MTSDHRVHEAPEERCSECQREAAFVDLLRSLWVRILLPCDELHLTVDLRRLPEGTVVLLGVGSVHGAPLDAVVLSQVSMDMFVAALDVHREELDAGVPDADDRLHAALFALARPIVLDREEARLVVQAARRLFPGLLEEVQAEAEGA